MSRVSKRDKNRQHDVEESCARLRKLLGDDDTLPNAINFSDGKVVPINTNVYHLSLKGTSSLYQYDVTLEPEILSSRLITHFVYSALCPKGGPMGTNEKWQKIIFDGQRIIYSSLDDLQGQFTVQPRKDTDKVVTVNITQTRKIESDDTESLLSIYNTAFHRAYHALNLSNFRRKWIDEKNVNKINVFQIYNGYLPSISYLSGGLSYVLNTATRIDRSGTLYDFIKDKNALNDPNARAETESAIRSMQIQTTHRPKKPKTVIVSSILWNEVASQKTFEQENRKTHEKRTISFADYYQEVYNHTCKPDDVLIEMVTRANGQDKVTIFPSSVLKASGISEAERRRRDTMKDIAQFTRISPQDRKTKLDRFVQSLKENEEASSFLNQWGFTLGSSVQVNGHVINPPTLEISKKNGGQADEYPLTDRLTYQSIFRDHGMYEGATIKNALLIVAPDTNRNDMPQFIKNLEQVAPGLPLNIPKINPSKHVLYVNNSHPNDYINSIAKYFEACVPEELPGFVICLIPSQEKKRYDGIKHFLTVELGVLSQCVKTQTVFQKPNLSVYTNIAVQIASKLGGVPFKVKVPLKSTMVIGLSLPSSSLRGTSPVCAGTCSTDFGLVHFYSNMKPLQRGENAIPEDFLREFVEEGLKRFNKRTGAYPKNIIVYRDGVTYAQMPKLKQIEVSAIVDTVKEVTGTDTISIVYMIAQKHASIRIMKEVGSNKVDNAGAGTVITDEIATKGVAEFYMISHYANQGSASPTRYTIIYHYPKFFDDDHLIKLTHFQTLQYPNWNGSIRTPACLMLASRLADMAKTHLSSDSPKDFLNNNLHFL